MNYEELMYRYGLFSEFIPPCFNSEKLYANIDKLKTSYLTSNSSECEEIEIYKTDIERRLIKVPNPEQYVYLCETLKKSIDEIRTTINNNKNTESNPFRIIKKREILDIPLYCESNNIKSSFRDSIKNRIRYSMGYKYELKVDISKFYDSIYTHMIEWCVVGKEAAKQKSTPTNFGEKLDKAVRSLQSNETKGIPTGPFTSRIISEYILANIDSRLMEENYLFLHYVDDYRFYFKTKSDAIHGLKAISNIFREFKLEINESKTEIKEYPFDIPSELAQRVYECRRLNKKESILYVISECNRLYELGEKASYKYTIKALSKLEKGELEQWIYLESFFLSALTIKPDLARYISKIILENKELVTDDFKCRLLEILKSNIEEKNECEITWLFWLFSQVKNINESIELDVIEDMLSIENDFVKIMTIDYIKTNKISNDKINLRLNNIKDELLKTEINKSSWLLLYESIINKWFGEELNLKIDSNDFFKLMRKNKITFYKL